MAYIRPGLGFTPDQETELLVNQRSYNAKLDKLVDQAEAADRIRTITIVATIGGLVYTLARIGELVAGLREKRRSSSSGEGTNW